MATPPFIAEDPERGDVPPRRGLLRFGVFELDLHADELRKSGALVRLQPQPLKLLRLLAGHPRRLFTRDEIQRELWGDGTYVDFEQGINFCISRVRAALGDQAESPRFVETVPRRGYRWVGPVEWVPAEEPPPLATTHAWTALGADRPSRTPGLGRAVNARLVRGSLLAVALLVVAAAAFVLRHREPRSEAPAAEGPAAVRWTRATSRNGLLLSARFARGDEIVYAAAWDGGSPALYQGRVGRVDGQELPLRGERLIGVSEAGELAFVQRTSKGGFMLSRVPLAGGATKDVSETARDGADWDGSEFAVTRTRPDGAMEVEYPLGHELGSLRDVLALRISPDRRHVAVLEALLRNDDRGRVVIFDRDGRRRDLGGTWASTAGLAWSPRGDEVWIAATREGSDLGLHALSLEGRERLLLPASGRLVLHDVDARGRALIERRTYHAAMPAAFGAEPEANLAWLGAGMPVAFSADGRTLLFVETGEGGGPDYTTFVRQIDGAAPVRVGPGRGTDLSPDGRYAAVVPLRQPDHVEILPVGAGAPRRVRFDGIEQYTFAGFHPDGRRLVFRGAAHGREPRVYVGSLDGGRPSAVGPEAFVITLNSVTPDGSAFVASGPDGRLYVVPLGGGPPRPIPGSDGDRFVGFADGGRAIFTWRGAPYPLTIEWVEMETGRRRPWRRVGPADLTGVVPMAFVVVARGGGAYVYTYMRSLSELFVVEGLR